MGTLHTITPPGPPPQPDKPAGNSWSRADVERAREFFGLDDLQLPARQQDSAGTRTVLRPLARLDVEQARQFVMELGPRTAGADLPRAMFLLGVLSGHAQSLLDVLDSVVTT